MERTVSDAGVRWNVVSVGAKGCVIFKPERVRDFRDFLGVDDRYSHAHWLVQHNGGAFLPPWGKVEQWLLSAQHDQADIDLFARNFRTFVAAVSR
jgi:glutamate-1-semialdehyde 2,1-aminomutase